VTGHEEGDGTVKAPKNRRWERAACRLDGLAPHILMEAEETALEARFQRCRGGERVSDECAFPQVMARLEALYIIITGMMVIGTPLVAM
jgi:hypothetical protein